MKELVAWLEKMLVPLTRQQQPTGLEPYLELEDILLASFKHVASCAVVLQLSLP